MAKNSKGFAKPIDTFSQVIQAERSFHERDISTPKAYDQLRKYGYCEHVAGFTMSMLNAVLNAVQGDLEEVIFYASRAYNYPSNVSYASERWDWMHRTILKNTGLDIGTPESHGLIPPIEHEKTLRSKTQS